MPNLEELKKQIDAFPSPHAKTGAKDERPGVLSDADKGAMEKALANLHAGGRETYLALVGMLVENDPPADAKVRHALGALAMQAGGWKPDDRLALAEALASTLGGDRPKEVQAFIIRQIQVCGTRAVAPAIGKLLTDADLTAPAADALLAIGDGAAEQFRAALPKATGSARLTCVQALGVLKDADSLDALRKAATDDDRNLRRTALWALANQGDPGAVDLLIKASDADGYERIEITKACLILGENLTAAGKRAEADKLYTHLRETRTDRSESYVKQIAERAMARAG